MVSYQSLELDFHSVVADLVESKPSTEKMCLKFTSKQYQFYYD